MNDDSPLDIYIYSDYVCPWCYLSTAAIGKIQDNFDVNLHWVPYPLHPDTPEEGLSLEELFGGRNMDQAHAQLQQRMAEAGLEYSDRDKTFNSRKAQELAAWADTHPGGEAVHKALFRAYFVHQRNLAKDDVLLDAVQEAGLNIEEAKQALQDRPFKQQVDQSWDKARQLGITGVPSFVAGGYAITGAQPYEELERFVEHVRSRL